MAEGNKSNVVLWIALGGLALVALCCVGVGGMMFWGYQQADAEMQRFSEEARRQQEIAEQEMRRQEELAEQEYARALEAQEQRPVYLETPPPPLSIAPTATRDRRPRSITATVVRADGSSGVSTGDRCEYDVTVEDSTSQAAGYWCRAFVECNGVRLYGTDTPRRNGFFPCEIFQSPLGVAGEDRDTTGGEGDPFFHIDTRARRFVVMDDATSMVGAPFRIEATILRVH